jgi:hypothetical protein
VEDHFGVGRSLKVAEQRRVDREHELSSQFVELGEEAVVNEQPATAAKGVAVGLLHRRADRRADVREEQRGLDVGGELAEVGIGPRGRDAAVQRRPVPRPVPAQPEAIAVSGLGTHPRVQTLVHDPVLGVEGSSSISTG